MGLDEPRVDIEVDSAPMRSHHESRRATVFDTPPSEIWPNLLLGGQKDAEDPALLKRLGIAAVLNVTPETPPPSLASDICYKQLPVSH